MMVFNVELVRFPLKQFAPDPDSRRKSADRRGGEEPRRSERPGRHHLHHRDNFPHRRAVASSKIERHAFPAPVEILQRTKVRGSQIGNVDIIANCGAVRRRIVRAKNLQRLAVFQGRANRPTESGASRVRVLRRVHPPVSAPAALKYRRATHRICPAAPIHSSTRSTASFESP